MTQILNGAPADVIVTANTSTMAQLTAKDLVETPQAFCQEQARDHHGAGQSQEHHEPRGPREARDFGRPRGSERAGRRRTSAKAMSMARVKVTPKSLQLDDAEVVEQVESGNADAALVFVTDIVSAGSKVTGVPIPDAQNKIGTYEIAAVKTSSNPAAAGHT